MNHKLLYIFIITGIIPVLAFHNIPDHILQRYLPKNPIILEAGAHKGTETIDLCKAWPQATVYAFEPHPNLFPILQKAVSPYSNVKTFAYALSNTCGTAQFNIASGSDDQSSSLLKPKDHLRHWPDITFNQAVPVRTITIDEWAAEEGIDHIDFIWFDLQGSEFPVLAASPKILKTVRAIFTEINFVELYEGCALYPIFKKWLETQGFVEVYKKNTHHTFGDALFVRT